MKLQPSIHPKCRAWLSWQEPWNIINPTRWTWCSMPSGHDSPHITFVSEFSTPHVWGWKQGEQS